MLPSMYIAKAMLPDPVAALSSHRAKRHIVSNVAERPLYLCGPNEKHRDLEVVLRPFDLKPWRTLLPARHGRLHRRLVQRAEWCRWAEIGFTPLLLGRRDRHDAGVHFRFLGSHPLCSPMHISDRLDDHIVRSDEPEGCRNDWREKLRVPMQHGLPYHVALRAALTDTAYWKPQVLVAHRAQLSGPLTSPDHRSLLARKTESKQ